MQAPELSRPVRGMSDASTLSVVVPTFEGRARLPRLLAALAEQTLPCERFEVIVAVDGFDDETDAFLRGVSTPFSLQLISIEHSGRASACNAGIRAATGDIVVLMDDDMEPLPGCLAGHLSGHSDREPACVMGAVPVIVSAESPPVTRYVAAKFARHLAKLAAEGAPLLRDFYSGNTSFDRDTLFRVGLFATSFVKYGNEDLELSFRLRAASIPTVFSMSAAAYHRYEKKFAALAVDTVAKGETAVHFASIHPDAFPDLQLASYRSGSIGWRVVRSAALALSKRMRVERGVVALTRAVERARSRRMTWYYTTVLDLLYWIGVMRALRIAAPTPALSALAEDINRGPIDLLLHR